MLKLRNKYKNYKKNYKNQKPILSTCITILCFSLLLFFGLGKITDTYNVYKEPYLKDNLIMTENLSVLYLYKNGFHPKDENVAFEYINYAKDKGILYSTKGRLEKDQPILNLDSYYRLDCSFVKENLMTDLGGEFLVSKDAKILYIDNKNNNTPPIKP